MSRRPYSAGARTAVGRGGAAGAVLAVLLAAAHTVNDGLMTMVAALLPALKDRFSLGETSLALLVATLWLGASFAQPFFGAMAARFGLRTVAVAGLATTSVVLSAIGVAPSTEALFAVVLIGGLGSAALHPVASAAARTAAGRSGALGVGFFTAGGEVGYALAPIPILALVAAFGLGATPALMVPGLVLAALTWRWLPPDRPDRAPTGTRSEGRSVLSRPMLALTTVGVLAALPFISFTSGAGLWIETKTGSVDSSLLAWTLAAFSLAGATGSVVGGALARRWPVRSVVTSTLAASLPALLAIHQLPPGGALFFATVAAAGLLLFANVPLLVVAAQDLAPGREAAASGMLLGVPTGAAALLYVGVGAVQEAIGITAALSLSYLAVLPAALVAAVTLGGAPLALPSVRNLSGRTGAPRQVTPCCA